MSKKSCITARFARKNKFIKAHLHQFQNQQWQTRLYQGALLLLNVRFVFVPITSLFVFLKGHPQGN